MAQNFQEFITTVDLNSEKAQNKLEKLTKLTEDLIKKREALIKSNGSKEEISRLTDNIAKNQKAMGQLEKQARSVGKTLNNLSASSLNDLYHAQRKLNDELKKTPQGTQYFNELSQKLAEVKGQIKGIRDLQPDGRSLFGKTVDFLNANWGAMTQVILTFKKVSGMIVNSIQDFSMMQEAMADTRKYTGLTAEGVEDLNEAFKKMDTRTPREKLNELAGAAGRLGKTTKEDILEFVDAADKIQVALGDDLGDGAIDQVGKLAMAFGEDDRLSLRGAMLATGSAINELAQNSSANAGYLVDFTARVAGAAKQLGMTQAQIMGFGAVMDENLLRDEMSATAFSQLLTKMASDTKTFAKLAGMDVKDFSNLVKTDMNGAVLALMDNLRKTDGFETLAKMLGDMHLNGTRAVSVLTTMADKIDDVGTHQKRATEAYQEATSVVSEFGTMNETVQARLEKAKKRLQEVWVELGQHLEPAAHMAIGTATMGVKTLSVVVSWLQRNWDVLIGAAAGIAAYNIALNQKIIAEKTDLVVSKAGWALKKAYAITVGVLTGKIKLATVAQHAWNRVVMANPYVAAAAGVALLTAGIVKLARWANDGEKEQRRMQERIEETTKAYEENKEKIEELLPVAQDSTKKTSERQKAIKELKQLYPDYFKKLDIETAKNYEVAKALQAQRKEMRAKLVLMKQEAKAEYEKYKATYNQSEKTQGTVIAGAYGNMNVSMRTQETQHLKDLKNAADEATKALAAFDAEMKKSNQETKADKGNGNGNGSGYESDADRKKREAESKKAAAAAKKRETEAKKAQKQELDDVKDAERQKLNEAQIALVAGNITFAEYLDKRLAIQVASLEEQAEVVKKYHDDEANELSQLEQKKLSLQQKFAEDNARLTQEQRKHAQEMAKLQVDADYNDPTSPIYHNEMARQNMLAQIELRGMEERLASMKEQGLAGTLDYMQAENELEEQREQALMAEQLYFEQRREEVREQFLGLGNEEQLRIALSGLEELHRRQLLSEEEYQRAKLAIQAQYGENSTDKANRLFDNGVSDAIGAARSKATGGYDKTKGLSMTNNPFVGQINEYKSTLEQLHTLREQDKIDHATYEQAKREVTSQFLSEMVSQAQAAYEAVGQIMSSASTLYSAQQKLEETETTKKYDTMIEKAGSSTAKGKKLEEKKQKELAAIKSKYNKKQMTIEMAQAVASTALAAINAYASASKVNWILGPIAAAAATAAGMMQIAAIKKQHQAEEAGYYEGGFTGGSSYRRKAGVVHEGEFVANHNAVGNSNLLPALQLIDQAQRNNTVGSLTAADVSRALGQGGATVVSAPVVNVQTDNSELAETLGTVTETVTELRTTLSKGIVAIAPIDGQNGIAKQLERFYQRKNNV